MVKVTGFTEDGRKVMGGLFFLADTHGIPLSLSLMLLEDQGHVPDMYGYIMDANKAGMSKKAIRARVMEACRDAHGQEYWEQVETRMSKVFEYLDREQ